MSIVARPFALFASKLSAPTGGRLARLATLLLAGGIATACLDDAPTEPADRSVQLAISARIQGLQQTAAYSVEVHAAYRRTSGELVDLMVLPSSPFAVPPGTSSHTLGVDIGPCLDDSQRQEPDPEACRLVVRLHLLDEDGAIVATANQDAPNPVKRGATVTLGTVALSPLPPATPIVIDPLNLDFVTSANAPTIPGSQTVTISTSEGGTLTGISVGSITYRPSDVAWLQPPVIDQASATSGAPATLTLQPATTSLLPGDYSATISIGAASGASNSPQTVTVNYRVDPASASPTIVLTPASLNFGPVSRSAATPGAKQVSIQSSTGAPISPLTISEVRYDPSDVPPWLVATLDPGGSVLTLVPGTTDLEPLTYTATITISSAVTGVVPQSVRVTYVVQPAVPAPPSRLTIALDPTILLVGQATIGTATVTDANGTVFASLPSGAVISWASSDPTVLANPTPTSPFEASATALRAGTTSLSATLTLSDRTSIASNTVLVTVNARQFTLSVHLAGNGAGTVTSLESGTPVIDCTWDGARTTGTCSAPFPEGQTVSLRAAAQASSSFDGWGEACASTEGDECSLVMNQDQNAAATFTLTSAGSITGFTRNAIDASPIPAASVELRAGADDTTGTPLFTTRSGADGSYSFTGLAAGTYTALARASGYINGQASEIAVSGQEETNRDIILSPILPEGQTRIVLTWGESPLDLDAHLTGPRDIESRFHVYYGDPGSLTGEPFAALDIDDTNGNGPETITIAQQRAGVYRFSVFNFSDRNSFENAALAGSGAHVQVFRGDELIAQFDVPQQQGILWTVFELNGTTLTPVNRMDYGPVTAPRNSILTDAAVIRSMLRTAKQINR